MLPHFLVLLVSSMPAPSPAAFDPDAHTTILTAHAEGAQIYQCKASANGALAWTFREPIASLIVDGKTVGRHYAGPHWALEDGSLVQGKVSVTVPGATPNDIPQLKLDIVAHQGAGALDKATLVYRVRTHGGGLGGPCPAPGLFRSISYSADYLFER